VRSLNWADTKDTLKENPLLLALGVMIVLALIVGVYSATRSTPPPPSAAPMSVNESPVKNPNFAEFESLDHDRISYYEFDIVGPDGTVLQTIQIPKSTTTISGNIVTAPIKLHPLQPGIYTSVIRAVIESSGTLTDSASPNGTRIPPADSIMDNEKDVWTMYGGEVLENGASTGGFGTELLWCNQIIYVAEGDGDWWKYESGGWHPGGNTDPCMGIIPTTSSNSFGRSTNSNVSNSWERAPIAVY
jgi:hypothetical protein